MKAILVLLCCAGVVLAQFPSDEEIEKIPAEQIIETQQHEIELLREAISIAKSQQGTLTDAQQKNTELQGKIDALAIHDQDCSIDNAKKNARIWKDNAAFVLIGAAVAGYLFLKFYMRLPI